MFYVVLFWTSLRERERKREGITTAARTRKEEIKSGTFGCGSFVVAYFQPATSTDCLYVYLFYVSPYPSLRSLPFFQKRLKFYWVLSLLACSW